MATPKSPAAELGYHIYEFTLTLRQCRPSACCCTEHEICYLHSYSHHDQPNYYLRMLAEEQAELEEKNDTKGE
jgi:hypothetical protein